MSLERGTLCHWKHNCCCASIHSAYKRTMYGSKVNFQTFRSTLQQAVASSTSEMGTSSASTADSASQQIQPPQNWSAIIMPSEDSVQEPTNASAGMSPSTGNPERESALARQLLNILVELRSGRTWEETQRSLKKPPTGVSTPAPETAEGDINMPGEEDTASPEEEYEAWLSREHHHMDAGRKTRAVEPYFNVQRTLRGDKYLEDIPPHIFRIWLCVQNSYLSIRLRDVEKKLDKEHKEELMQTYTYYMRNQTDLPGHIRRIKLPSSLTMEEIEADVLAIFDACLGGAVERNARDTYLYVFTAHRDTDPEEDIEFLTQKPMLVYDLDLKEFRKARVLKLWENEQWKTWPDCK